MSYSELFILTVPESLADVAAKIGRALDPDTGGDKSFSSNGNGTITAKGYVEPEFKDQAEYLMTDANALYAVIQQKYAERWAELTPPTLAECQAFIAAIIQEIQP